MIPTLSPELHAQIEQEAKSSAANFNYYPESNECEDLESAYVTGATKYTSKWQEAEQRAERYEKALKEIQEHIKNVLKGNTAVNIMGISLIISEALTPKTTNDE